MSKTMTETISEHAKHGIRDGRHVCHGKGCAMVYQGDAYPEAIVVTAHVVNQLIAAGFGSKHDAWAEGFKQGGPMHDEHHGDPDRHTRNPYPATR